MMRLLFLTVFVVCTPVEQTAAGSIENKQIRRYMDWEPDCYKPSPPAYYVSDIESYNWAVSEFNSYLFEVESYISCIQREAEEDIKILSQVISNGIEENRSEILIELDSARSELEFQRLYLE